MNFDRNLPALPTGHSLVASRHDASELVVVGQFALRQRVTHASHAAYARPPHAQLGAQPVEPPWAGYQNAQHGSHAQHVQHGPHGPTTLPTEAYLALRSATASHRKAAYAACA